jgi:hypothetical protein
LSLGWSFLCTRATRHRNNWQLRKGSVDELEMSSLRIKMESSNLKKTKDFQWHHVMTNKQKSEQIIYLQLQGLLLWSSLSSWELAMSTLDNCNKTHTHFPSHSFHDYCRCHSITKLAMISNRPIKKTMFSSHKKHWRQQPCDATMVQAFNSQEMNSE